MAQDVLKILKRLDGLITERQNWDNHWQEIAELVWPAGDEFNVKKEPGVKRSESIFDATAPLALEKFAAVMESLLTPRAQTWHRLRASNEELNKDQDVKSWFEEVTRILFATRNSPDANYYSQKHEGYKSLGAFGNDCLFVDELPPTAERPQVGIRYKYCHIGQIYIMTNHIGVVDTIYRKYPMSARAVSMQWPDNIPPKIATVVEKDPTRKFPILHLVRPRHERDPQRVDPLNKPFESVYISIDDKMMIDEGGFEEMPYMYSRYTVNPMENHGRSPAMLVLPAIKTANEMQKTFLRAGHKVVDPPLLLHDDGKFGSGTSEIRLFPGGINYGGVDAKGNPLIIPLQTGARLDLTEGMLEKERDVINEAFLVKFFQLLRDVRREMTATEVLELAEEKGLFLGPAIGRQQSEMLGPQVAREVNIHVRNGLVPEMPGLLVEAEGEYEIEYDSDATRFQRSAELAATDRTVARAVVLGEFDRKALLILDSEKILRLSQKVEGAPTEILVSPEQLEEKMAAMQQAEAAQMALEAQAQLAKSAKDEAQAEQARPEVAGGV